MDIGQLKNPFSSKSQTRGIQESSSPFQIGDYDEPAQPQNASTVASSDNAAPAQQQQDKSVGVKAAEAAHRAGDAVKQGANTVADLGSGKQ